MNNSKIFRNFFEKNLVLQKFNYNFVATLQDVIQTPSKITSIIITSSLSQETNPAVGRWVLYCVLPQYFIGC